MMALSSMLLLAVGAQAQVPVPNARQLEFMDLELTQFMCENSPAPRFSPAVS